MKGGGNKEKKIAGREKVASDLEYSSRFCTEYTSQ